MSLHLVLVLCHGQCCIFSVVFAGCEPTHSDLHWLIRESLQWQGTSGDHLTQVSAQSRVNYHKLPRVMTTEVVNIVFQSFFTGKTQIS